MSRRTLFLIAGSSYIVIFVTAIFANFFVLDSILHDPIGMVMNHGLLVRFGAVAFLVAAVADVIVAWALYELSSNRSIARLSAYFRIIHAVLMGAAVFALPLVFTQNTAEGILLQVNVFTTIWLIGLFFFGMHLLLLPKTIPIPKFITVFLVLAGVMYMVDTVAHIVLEQYSMFADIFLTLVAVPSILGEMLFACWLLRRGLKE